MNDTSEDKRSLFNLLRKSKSVNAVCGLLGIEKRTLELLARQPKYKIFEVSKNRHGENRLIEDPSPPLKRLQSKLNKYLQSAYYFEKSSASFGFVANLNSDDDKRNILANARKHLERPWLLQLDLSDFFHYVTEKKVYDIFARPPFVFKEDLSLLLTALTTYQGRLPMGAPTSPVLSNFACRMLDERILDMADAKNWVFTRYVDDFTFSAKRPFTDDEVSEIKSVIREEGFEINLKKLQRPGPDEDKIVTGILLRGKGELKPGFLEELEKETRQLHDIMDAQNYHGEIRTHWVDKMKQQVRGKIAFAGFVLGNRNETYIRLKDAYYVAINPPEEDFGAVSWRGFHYLG